MISLVMLATCLGWCEDKPPVEEVPFAFEFTEWPSAREEDKLRFQQMRVLMNLKSAKTRAEFTRDGKLLIRVWVLDNSTVVQLFDVAADQDDPRWKEFGKQFSDVRFDVADRKVVVYGRKKDVELFQKALINAGLAKDTTKTKASGIRP